MPAALPIPLAPQYSHPSRGAVRVVPPGQYEQQLADRDKMKAAAYDKAAMPQQTMTDLAGYVRGMYDMFRTHRDMVSGGWSNRLMHALRTFNGEYHPSKLAEIKQFGGSEVYARIVAMKCRGASSLLRDVYLSPDRPWGLAPPADPDVPPEMVQNIQTLVQGELASNMQLGGPGVDVDAVRDRVVSLMELARLAAKKKASKQAKIAEDKI